MKLLTLLALTPLAIGTPALAGLDSQYHTDRQDEHMRATRCHVVKEKVQWQAKHEWKWAATPPSPDSTETLGYHIAENGTIFLVQGSHKDCSFQVDGYLNKEYVNNEKWSVPTRILFKYENGSLVRYHKHRSGGQIFRTVFKPFAYRGNNSNEYRLDNACKNWSYNNPAVRPSEKQSEYNRCRKNMGPAFHLPGR